MSGTTEENTRFVWVWLDNDADHLGAATEAAKEGGADGIQEYVRNAFAGAKEGDPWGIYETAREMTPSDMERVDWAEIAADLGYGEDEDEKTD